MSLKHPALAATLLSLFALTPETARPDPLNTDNAMVHLRVLASEQMQGRRTGHEGQKKAAAYIADQFQSIGLVPAGNMTNYLQSFDLVQNLPNEIWLETAKGVRLGINDMGFHGYVETGGPVETWLKFIGEGTASDLSRIQRGDVILAYTDDPFSVWRAAKNAGAAALFLIEKPDASFRITTKEIRKPGSTFQNWPSLFNLSLEQGINVLGASTEAIQNALDDPSSLDVKITYQIDRTRGPINTANVVGFLPGKEGSKETVLVAAHYDHLGPHGDTYFPGADDNASGTSALIATAKALAAAPEKLGKNLLFIAFTGEEYGLLGSRHFVENSPVDLSTITAVINAEMFGRRDPSHETGPAYLYPVGSKKHSNKLHGTIMRAAKDTGVTMDQTFNSGEKLEGLYSRSDHYPFAEKGIPAVMLFGGVHADYDKPTDTIDKIDQPLLMQRTMFLTELVRRLTE